MMTQFLNRMALARDGTSPSWSCLTGTASSPGRPVASPMHFNKPEGLVIGNVVLRVYQKRLWRASPQGMKSARSTRLVNLSSLDPACDVTRTDWRRRRPAGPRSTTDRAHRSRSLPGTALPWTGDPRASPSAAYRICVISFIRLVPWKHPIAGKQRNT